MNKSLKVFLVAAMILAVAVSAFSFIQYRKDLNEYSVLRSDLEASIAAWKETDKKKREVQDELNSTKNEIREAERDIEEYAEKTEKLEKEIEILEKEIESLRSLSP